MIHILRRAARAVRGPHHLALLLSLLLALPAAGQDSLLFVVRVDDVQSRSTIEPRRITAFEDVVAERGGRVSWAVIPHRLVESQNADGQLAADLRGSSARGHEIVQHGYTHICPRCDRSSHEFWCTTYETPFTYEEQQERIAAGRALIEEHLGVTPTAFVPPGHHDDGTTYEVLDDAGFRTMSTTQPSGARLHGALLNVGSFSEYTWALETDSVDVRLSRALDRIREAADVFVMMYHDPFVRGGYEDGVVLDWTVRLLDSLQAGAAGRPVRYATLSEARDHLAGTASTVEPPEPAATALALHGPSPHPVRGRTAFDYSLDDLGEVTLTIYDLLGREVSVVARGSHPSGRHRATWSAAGLAPGVYVAHLRAGSRTATRPFVVVD